MHIAPFNKEFFKRWQPVLRMALKTKWFKDMMGLPDEDIVELGTSHYAVRIDKHHVKKVFFTWNIFKYKLRDNFGLFWKLVHEYDVQIANYIHPSFNLGFDLLALNMEPDDDVESSSVDGYLQRNNASGETWATMRDHTDATSVSDNATSLYVTIQTDTNTNQYDLFRRGVFLFDSSTWTTGTETIYHAFLTFNLSGSKVNTLGATATQSRLHACSSAPASNTALATGDYDSLGTTSFGYSEYADIPSGGGAGDVFSIQLNDDGVAGLTLNGVSKLGIRWGADIDNSETTWSSATKLEVNISPADSAATRKNPTLTMILTDLSSGSSATSIKGRVGNLPKRFKYLS